MKLSSTLIATLLALLSLNVSAISYVGTPLLTLKWNPVTTGVQNGISVSLSPASSVTYNLYQGTTCAALTKVQTGIVGTSATVTAGLTTGTTPCFALTSVYQGVESARTTPLSIPIPTGHVTVSIQ